LVLGSFKLEDTDQAVTSDQAQALIPLWQAVQSLSQSDTTAPEEMAALASQIQGTYTAAQIDAIDAMALSPQDMQTILSDLGLSFGPTVDGTPVARDGAGGGGGFGPPEGGDGFGPGGGGGPGAGGFNPQDLSPEQQATFEARRAAGVGTRGAGVPAPLLTALIELLQDKAG
jgi:hypothetical protein